MFLKNQNDQKPKHTCNYWCHFVQKWSFEKQSSLSTFVKKFLNKEGEISDTVGYHKAVYAARNADTIAQHFYEQGKADAVKDVIAKSNNINAEPRPSSNGDVFIGGLKVKAVNGVDSSKLKFKTRKKNN